MRAPTLRIERNHYGRAKDCHQADGAPALAVAGPVAELSRLPALAGALTCEGITTARLGWPGRPGGPHPGQ
jgi:hypothetical protein